MNPTELADRILQVAETLALTQARNPNERDDAGFSNADYPLAFALVAGGDVQGLAAMLLLYPRQAADHGLAAADLLAFTGEAGRLPRAEARAALQRARTRVAGLLGWTAVGDHVLFNGVDLDFTLRAQLRRWGRRTPQGWQVPVTHLALALADVDRATIARPWDLDALIEQVPQAAAEAPAPRPAPAARRPVFRVTGTAVDWTEPFSPTGSQVRALVKAAGGRWDGSTWNMTPIGLQALGILVSGLDVDATALPEVADPEAEALADEVASGVTVLRLKQVKGTTVWYTTRAKVPSLWETAQAHGARWDRKVEAVAIEAEDLEPFLKALERLPQVDGSAMLPALQEHEARREAELRTRPAIDVPETTPQGHALFAHQRDGVQFLVTLGWDNPDLRGGILADDMGLGKTLQASVAAHQLLAPTDRILVVVPASLKSNWAREIRQWIGPDQTVQVLQGRRDTMGDARWIVVNYDIVAHYFGPLRAAGFALAILDEAHVLRNATIQRSVALGGAPAKKAKKGKPAEEAKPGILDTVDRVWLLTGTPILNRPKELFHPLGLIRHPLGADWFRFAIRYCDGKKGGYGWNFNGASNMAELGRKLGSAYLRRLKTEVLDLPPKLRGPYTVDLDEAALTAYEAAVDAMLGRLDAGEEGEDAAEDCVLAELNALKLQTARAKIPATVELVQELVEQGRKVVVFSQYHEVLDALQANFLAAAVRIDGSVAPAKRQAIVDTFQQNPAVQVFLGQTDAAGVGLTLTASQDVVVNDLPWTPAILAQAEDRCYRIGQTGTVQVRYMEAAGTFDLHLRQVLTAKEAVIRAFEEGAEVSSRQKQSVVRQVLAAIRKDAKAAATMA